MNLVLEGVREFLSDHGIDVSLYQDGNRFCIIGPARYAIGLCMVDGFLEMMQVGKPFTDVVKIDLTVPSSLDHVLGVIREWGK